MSRDRTDGISRHCGQAVESLSRIAGSVRVHTSRHHGRMWVRGHHSRDNLARLRIRYLRVGCETCGGTCGTFCAAEEEEDREEGWNGRNLSFALSFSVLLHPKAPQTKLPKLGLGQETRRGKTRVTCRHPKEREGRISAASRSGFVTGWLT